MFLFLKKQSDDKDQAAIIAYFRTLTLCHAIVPSVDKDGKVSNISNPHMYTRHARTQAAYTHTFICMHTLFPLLVPSGDNSLFCHAIVPSVDKDGRYQKKSICVFNTGIAFACILLSNTYRHLIQTRKQTIAYSHALTHALAPTNTFICIRSLIMNIFFVLLLTC